MFHVNVNTIVRTFGSLQRDGQVMMPEFFRNMCLLSVEWDEMKELFRRFSLEEGCDGPAAVTAVL